MTFSIKRHTTIRRAILLVTAILVCLSVSAQEVPYKYSLGARLGMSGYVGEASSNIFSHPGFGASGNFNYQYDARWVFGGSIGYQSLSGSTADMDNVLPGGAVYSFKSNVVDLAGHVEFNFFSFGMGETYKRFKRWTPYLSLGVGVCMAMCDGETSFAPTLPMGAGIKYKVSERINLNIEFMMIKAFGDHIDGPELSDLQQIKSSFIKNNDWYSRISVGFTYEFGRRCETCHYVD